MPRRTIERFLPNGSMDLLLNLGEEAEKILTPHVKGQDLKECWISGLQARYIRIETPINMTMMGVEFKPGGAYPFLGFSMSKLRDSCVDLDSIWGREAMEVRHKIQETRSEAEKFFLLESWLLGRLHPDRETPHEIEQAIRLIQMCGPALRISAIAKLLNISHKKFLKRFEDIVGVTPKYYSRICRFQRALQTISRNGSVDLTAVAVGSDYFDQSHFIKEFEEFAGMTPGEYLRVRGFFPDWVSE